MIPFNETLWLWRAHRGFTQEALARRARIPRPNLSAMEQGKREVSLGTLRALAVALDIRPGVLADGVPPALTEGGPPVLTREVMERIAAAVVAQKSLQDQYERRVANALQQIVRNRLAISKRHTRVRQETRATQAAWVWLKATYSVAVVRSLLQRITDQQRRDDSTAN